MNSRLMTEVLAAGFPQGLRGVVSAVSRLLPEPAYAPNRAFEVIVEGEVLSIPYRLYFDEPPEGLISQLDEREQTVFHCVYSRHHDGFVRQPHIEALLSSPEPWVVPYVVQPIGEYVVEILESIRRGLGDLEPGDARRDSYRSFVESNQDYVKLTSQRVVSYWNCYYRFRYPDRADAEPNKVQYPGFRLMDILSSLD